MPHDKTSCKILLHYWTLIIPSLIRNCKAWTRSLSDNCPCAYIPKIPLTHFGIGPNAPGVVGIGVVLVGLVVVDV